MKKIALLFIVVLFVSACTLTPNDNNNNNNNNDNGNDSNYEDPVRPDGEAKRSYSGDGLELELFFKDGSYTYFGTAQLPTPCHEIKVDSLIAESFPEQVTLEFRAVSKAENCAQVITAKTFIGDVSVSENASFTIIYNGKRIQAN